MKAQTFYRCAVWLPLLVPAAVAYAAHGLGLRPASAVAAHVLQVLLVSGLYGGPAHLGLAAYATWWIDGRPESEIRRKALQAPLWMVAAWLAFAALLGVLSRNFEMFAGLAALGSAVSVLLGYVYVAVVFLLRRALSAGVRQGIH